MHVFNKSRIGAIGIPELWIRGGGGGVFIFLSNELAGYT